MSDKMGAWAPILCFLSGVSKDMLAVGQRWERVAAIAKAAGISHDDLVKAAQCRGLSAVEAEFRAGEFEGPGS